MIMTIILLHPHPQLHCQSVTSSHQPPEHSRAQSCTSILLPLHLIFISCWLLLVLLLLPTATTCYLLPDATSYPTDFITSLPLILPPCCLSLLSMTWSILAPQQHPPHSPHPGWVLILHHLIIALLPAVVVAPPAPAHTPAAQQKQQQHSQFSSCFVLIHPA